MDAIWNRDRDRIGYLVYLVFVVLHELPEADHEVVDERRLELLELVLQVDDDRDDELDVALLDHLQRERERMRYLLSSNQI